MRRRKVLWAWILYCAGCLWLGGCSGGGQADQEDVEEAGISDGADDREPPGDRPQIRAAPSLPPSTPPTAAPNVPFRKSGTLVKTVVQQLRQQTSEGWANSRSALELTMTITPDEKPGPPQADLLHNAQAGGMSYRVEYQRIRFSQELPGQGALTYDSDSAPLMVPLAIRPYHGLKNNGFQFRLSRELQLADVVGFEAFLERCLQPLPPEQRAAVRLSLPVRSPVEAVGYFVDESLGSIPPEASRAGDNWIRSREFAQPIPCIATTRHTLRQVTSEAADVDVTGAIVAVDEPVSPKAAAADAVQIQIVGGQIIGQCRVDRRSGLPLRSHVEQSLEMRVRLADGTEFPQFKTTVTTLEAPADAREVAPITLIGGVRPASPLHSSPTPSRPEQAAFSHK